MLGEYSAQVFQAAETGGPVEPKKDGTLGILRASHFCPEHQAPPTSSLMSRRLVAPMHRQRLQNSYMG